MIRISAFNKAIGNKLLVTDTAQFESLVNALWVLQDKQPLSTLSPEELLSFCSALDSSMLLRDRQYPLRLGNFLEKGKSVPGDIGIQVTVASQFLNTCFPDASLQDLSWTLIEKPREQGAPLSRFFSLVVAARALDARDYAATEHHLLNALSQFTDCVLASRINMVLVAASSGQYGNLAAAQDITGRICLHPFNTVLTTDEGQGSYGLRMCDCPSMLPYGLDKEDPWNGPVAQEIRRSILEGGYSYCARQSCYHIHQGTLPKKADVKDTYIREIIDNNLIRLPCGPYSIILAHDTTCNLFCPSCRAKPLHADTDQKARHDAFFRTQVKPLMGENLNWVRLGYTGEAFASQHVLSSIVTIDYNRYDKLKFFVISNGTLITPDTWEKLGPAAERMTHLRISIDGASESSYESLRKPAKWKTIKKNMDFIKSLREAGSVKYLCVVCIVQKTNANDLEKLYRYCLSWGVDELVFAPLRNWGAFSEAYYNEHNVALPGNPLYEATRSAIESIVKSSGSETIKVHVGLY